MPPFTREQRYQIECDLRSGMDKGQIAQRLVRSARSIEREIARCGLPAHYTAEGASTVWGQVLQNSISVKAIARSRVKSIFVAKDDFG